MKEVFVYEALRTPRAKAKSDGRFAQLLPSDLLEVLYQDIDARHSGVLSHIDMLELGCVGQTGSQGGHIALVSKSRSALIPDKASAHSLNNFCVSGLSAIQSAARAIHCGDAELALAGGVESMSSVPFLADRATHYQDPHLAQKTRFMPPVVSADLLATLNAVSRDALDEVTTRSHQRAGRETGSAAASLIAVRDKDGNVLLDHNEYVRRDTTAEGLSHLDPAFAELDLAYSPIAKDLLTNAGYGKIVPSHCVAHCPGMSDGAAVALLGTASAGRQLGLKPKARIRAMAEAGGDPVQGLTAGFTAFDLACSRGACRPEDFACIEAMEAFAITPVLFEQRYPQIDTVRVNPFGGHLAKGHPMGASGAILLSALLDALHSEGAGGKQTTDRAGAKLGAVMAAGGSGVGSAMIVEAIE